MISFKDATATALRSTLCAVLAVNDDGQRLFGRVVGDQAADYFNVAGALRTQICNIDPDDQEELEPPFTGGQCNTQYTVFFTSNGTDLSIGGQTPRNLQGPLPSPTLIETVIGTPFPDSTQYTFQFGSDPNNFVQATLRATFNPGPGFRIAGRVDSQPDDCGDPPPIIPPPGPVERPITVIYDIDDSTDITLNGTVIFAPIYVDLSGATLFPITLDLGGFTWSGDIKIAPEFEVNINPDGIGPERGVNDDDEEPFPDDPSDPSIDLPEDLPSTIIGVEVFAQVNNADRTSSIAFTNGPNIYAPRLASVKFAIRTRQSMVWTADIDVKNRESYVPCPAAQGAVAVRVSPMPGVTVRWNAVRERPLLQLD